VVGPETLLSVRELVADQVVWLAADVPATSPTPCQVQVRAHGAAVDATVVRVGDTVNVSLAEPMRGVAAGQSAVLYQGTRVLGQGTIGHRP